jgi:hypothetical protein
VQLAWSLRKKVVPRWAIHLAQDTQDATQHSNLDGQRSVRYPRNHLRSGTFLPNLVVQGRDRCHGIISASAGGSLLPDDGSSQEFATVEEVREEAVEGARQLLSNAVLTATIFLVEPTNDGWSVGVGDERLSLFATQRRALVKKRRARLTAKGQRSTVLVTRHGSGSTRGRGTR